MCMIQLFTCFAVNCSSKISPVISFMILVISAVNSYPLHSVINVDIWSINYEVPLIMLSLNHKNAKAGYILLFIPAERLPLHHKQQLWELGLTGENLRRPAPLSFQDRTSKIITTTVFITIWICSRNVRTSVYITTCFWSFQFHTKGHKWEILEMSAMYCTLLRGKSYADVN